LPRFSLRRLFDPGFRLRPKSWLGLSEQFPGCR